MLIDTEWGSRKLYCDCNSDYTPEIVDFVDFPEEIKTRCEKCNIWQWFFIDVRKGQNYQRRLKYKGVI